MRSLDSQVVVQDYLNGVQALDNAISALPPSLPLTAALRQLEVAEPLSPVRPTLLNVTEELRLAILALPTTTSIEASLLAYNRSKYALPPLINDALAAIVRYDTYGDESGIGCASNAEASNSRL